RNVAVGIDRRCNSAVRVAQQPAPVLHGSYPRHAEMLFRSRRSAKPAVVGNVHQKFRSVLRKCAYFSRINSFITDKNGKLVAIRKHPNAAFLPFVEATYLLGHAGNHLMNKRERL